jgi:peptidoglycan/LPS O-acetylase OafA/YrhL
MDQRLPGIHGLRAVAATGIVLFHLAHLETTPPNQLNFISTHFGYAVPLFFVLSGFSLGYSTSDHVGSSRWIEIYFIKRFFRIAPLFYTMLCFTLLFFYVRGAIIDTARIAEILLNITFAFNFIPGRHESIVFAGWTIGVEMIFYALFPLILTSVRGLLPILALTVIGIAVSLSARIVLPTISGLPSSYGGFCFISNLEYFVIGILSFRIFALLKFQAVATKSIQIGGFAAVILFVAILMVAPAGCETAVWGLLFGALCVWQGLAPGFVAGSRYLSYLGERSYSIYLLHPLSIFFLAPLFGVIKEGLGPLLGSWTYIPCALILLTVIYLLATISYALIETPGNRVGKFLVGWIRTGSVFGPQLLKDQQMRGAVTG